MTLKRTPSTGKPGRPSIQLSPQDLEDIRQHALAGRSQTEIAKLMGVSTTTWQRIGARHPAVRTIIADAYACIGYESRVTERRATLQSEAEQRGDDPADINIETYSNSELDQLYSLARQGLPSHAIPKHMKPPMPPAIWSKLWNSDARGKAVHAKGIAAAASEVVKNVEEPPVQTTNSESTFTLSDHPEQLARNHSILLRAGDIEETEPERSDLMGTVAHWLMHREELSETATGRVLSASVEELREWLAMLVPEKADDELQKMLQ